MNTLYRLRASYRLIQATTPASLGFLLRSRYSTKSKKQESQQDKTTSTNGKAPQSHGLEVSQINNFFANYPSFDFKQSEPLWPQYRRLRKSLGLQKKKPKKSHDNKNVEEDEETKQRREEFENAFKAAMTLEFNDLYGTDANDITCWWALCNALDIRPPPDTLDECTKVVKSKYVNIVDFVETKRTGKKIKIFKTLPGLQDYTKSKKKFFPLEAAKAGGVLEGLLQKILRS